jgi:hypothetical protein
MNVGLLAGGFPKGKHCWAFAWRSFHTVIRCSASSRFCRSVARRAAASCSAALRRRSSILRLLNPMPESSSNGRKCQRPLWPRKLPRVSLTSAAAKGHKQHFAPQQRTSLFDRLVGARDERRWDFEAESPSSLEIDAWSRPIAERPSPRPTRPACREDVRIRRRLSIPTSLADRAW